MTRIVLIHAGPTPWDQEDRLVGNHPLPLTEEGRETIRQTVSALKHPLTEVYRFKKNEACEQAARIIAAPFELRPRDSSALDEVNLGLWQGLTRTEWRYRYPKVVEQWRENPLSVKPPEGESLGEAIERLRGGLGRILRRNRGVTIALALRPYAMQIMLGLLRREDAFAIAGHANGIAAMETVEIGDHALHEFL